MSLVKVLDAFRQHQKFLVCTHMNPDPDALASQIALGLYLEGQDKKVVLISEKPIPKRFSFLPHISMIKALGRKRVIDYDAMIVTDSGDLDRIGDVRRLLQPEKLMINIDHHITNTGFGDINYVLPKSSSTCEVIFGLLKAAKVQWNKPLAELLYVGAMTDTGSFRYSNTASRTHAMVAELMEFDVAPDDLYKKIYEQVPLMDIKYFTKVVSGFQALNDGKLVCVDLPKRIVKKFSAQFDLRDKIFGYLRTIEGVEVLVIFTEEKRNQTRVNLRSQGKVDVARFAARFKGGGHSKASGCLVTGDIKAAHRKILPEIKKFLK